MRCEVSPSHYLPKLNEQPWILLARILLRTHLVLFFCTTAKTVTQISESLQDAQETNIINGLAFRGLCGANREGDATTLHDDVYSLLMVHDVPKRFLVAEQVQKDMSAALHAGDIGVFSVTYVSGHCQTAALGVNCAANRAYLIPQFQVPGSTVIQSTLSHLSFWEAGRCRWYFCNSTGDHDGSLVFGGMACDSCN
jgi:hypothetical protein